MWRIFQNFMQHKFVSFMLCFGAEFVELGQVGAGSEFRN